LDRTVGIDIFRLALSGEGPDVEAPMYDLAGQDVYTLSHSLHFTGRCMCLLLWRPNASLESALANINRWLETLIMYVPDAVVVLVGSHCQSLPEDEYQILAGQVRILVEAKVAELNDLSVLEAQQLHVKYEAAKTDVKAAIDAYKAATSANEASKRADEPLETSIRTLLE